MSDIAMQAIAKEIGFPETAFVELSSGPDFRIRFFTPTNEVDMCGHATIATWSLLHRQGIVSIGTHHQEIRASRLAIEIKKDGSVWMKTPSPILDETLTWDKIAHTLNNEIPHSGMTPQIISTGLRDILVHVPDLATLNSLAVKHDRLSQLNRETNTIALHVFTTENTGDGYTAHTRNFAPLYGIPEEAATGSSNASLACYLLENDLIPRTKNILRFAQGDKMGSPSEILVDISVGNGKIIPHIGGRAALFETKSLTI